MALCVWVEPTFSVTPWYPDFCAGLKAAGAKARIDVADVPPDADSPDSMVFLLGETARWFEETADRLTQRGVPACVVTCSSGFLPYSVSSITNAHGRDTANLLRYMRHYGRAHTAVFGFNPSSPVDRDRLSGNTASPFRVPDEDIYFAIDGVKKPADELIRRIDRYDSVIAGNDVYAIYLVSRLREAGVRVPEDAFVASFGNIPLSERVTPSISSMSVDLNQMASVAVAAYAGWRKKSWSAHFTFTVESAFYPRASTSCLPMPRPPRDDAVPNALDSCERFSRYHSSYTDESLYFISSLNNFLQKSDESDIRILHALRYGTPFDRLADELYLSKRGLDYRLAKIYKLFRIHSRKELKDLLARYADVIAFE